MSFVFAPSSLRFVRGTTWQEALQITDTAGTPVNLTGVSYLMLRVRRDIDDADEIIELSTTNGRITITTAATGLIAILVDAEDTLAFPINDHVRYRCMYDCIISRGGSPEVIEPGFGGKVTVIPQTTRKLAEP